ncbi:MAG TPA: UDP-N-acetylmuramate--L-alanine ligase [Tepidisphaeraceae bacterium]|jgi:UDP-N-acetylmuramate--alanine ligase|nr:UDP-N-acetylmuramate--L-alanine ligase [Tepidisphaeraceae bacterium]
MESRTAGQSQFAGRHVHFIGIGGSGMSGLARMLLDRGAIVSGSEPKPNQQTFDLMRRGVRISRTQSGELLSRDLDLVVRTAAVPENNGEYLAARAMHLQQVKYAELLGQVMGERLGVAIAGTHGKSTTTAMTAFGLVECGAEPSFVVGGTVPQLGGGSRSGKGQAFVAEACEFDRSFHNLRPTVACITNIEADHLDCYRNILEIVESFHAFCRLVPEDGLILANGADLNVTEALRDIKAPIQTVAIDVPADWSVTNFGEEAGCYRGEISFIGKPAGTLRLSVAGVHNLFNATLAVAACAACGVEPGAAAEAISRFTGVDRRMTEVGTYNGAIVVDDYGHHPTEIRTTLAALRGKYKPTRLLCVFQPHQASRTRLLFHEFARSFEVADEAILADIYFVRDSEADRASVNSADLVAQINRNGQHARHLPNFADITEYLRKEARPGDLIVTMGAGSVWEIGRDLVSSTSGNSPVE